MITFDIAFIGTTFFIIGLFALAFKIFQLVYESYHLSRYMALVVGWAIMCITAFICLVVVYYIDVLGYYDVNLLTILEEN